MAITGIVLLALGDEAPVTEGEVSVGVAPLGGGGLLVGSGRW